MIELMQQLDTVLFISINHLPHNFFSDSFFALLSGIGTGGLIWLVIAAALFIWEEIKDKKGFVALLVAGIFVILFIDLGLKNLVRRPRPEFAINSAIVVYDKRDSFSFPSIHATLALAAAYILANEHKKWGILYYILAVLIAFSRVYLGKHYPSDVIIGALLGLLIGYISLEVIKYLYDKRRLKKDTKTTT